MSQHKTVNRMKYNHQLFIIRYHWFYCWSSDNNKLGHKSDQTTYSVRKLISGSTHGNYHFLYRPNRAWFSFISIVVIVLFLVRTCSRMAIFQLKSLSLCLSRIGYAILNAICCILCTSNGRWTLFLAILSECTASCSMSYWLKSTVYA